MPELKINLTMRARQILDELKEGSGWDSDEHIIVELIYTMNEIEKAISNGDVKNVAGIVSTFTRFSQPKS
jgi:hypothetical protein